MISEVVCRQLFRAAGLHVLEAAVVEASPTFAESWNEANPAEKPITSGQYFGTVYVPDPWGGSLESLEQAESPHHLALIWLIDCLVCNIDRNVRGNLMLIPKGTPPKLRTVPADNSDCFCGSLVFSSGEWRDLMSRRGPATGVLVVEAIASIGGATGLRIALDRVRSALTAIGAGLDEVPSSWWDTADIRPEQVEESLWGRLERLPSLINIERWGGGFTNGEDGEIPLIQL